MQQYNTILFLALMMGATACQSSGSKNDESIKDSSMIRLITLDPGHFHAALVQKVGYPGVDTTVHVYAPEGPELQSYLSLVNQYNERADNPTHWKEEIYTGSDFAEKMLEEKKGNVVVLSGNNRLKTDYIQRSVAAGLNVLADKPMAINSTNFTKLVQAFGDAAKKKVLLYDIMTERSEITNILQQELIQQPELFGELKKGTAKDPAVMIESVHYFFKNVSGKPLVRPEWFFDAEQQGDAIADVGTHLVDLVQWQCFPGVPLDYTKDIRINAARVWPTPLTLSQYASITGKNTYPEFLKKDIVKDSVLNTHANGEMNYTLKDIHVRIIARWDYKAAEGGDTHHEIIKGTKATLEIRQGKAENYKPVLYIIPSGDKKDDYDTAVQQAMTAIAAKYPGVKAEKQGPEWKVVIPSSYDVGHEAHFGQVMERYLQYMKEGGLPDWEVPNMIAKYYTTTKALETATKH
ncbi:putative oxidoreductase C-terminal domain-containing protein [Agriterribacter sp.]|uniref:putative oxidoreductase C-terminal domain-containing protein n=1 Tax=Agriterribacter sp. TaxID=2821509 RepID=UPI002BE226A3|nr:putative oxidoreductase C-terminal domain-containing protein [Agriterribacter sp.]HRP58494.1 putative oxidoreductase C-terminal domain-containing protein [Agriterribacter sp.]